ncbi:hypothetical protein M441DRAFT_420042 [Trichoderma asperellum CBS 433.97]|uniref:Uncharacterized protein n=1 Tax=Trichoderma asperellum (strain ATCC 204424 / CBS 433.97 / NBRC 101777) TaxID=1042311 RepID=A0A2T3Z4Q8_TRIA4|nr:hypothetical protein M441DRAFT_420042 [Trichoderma asperellum CBS 433.97]PTB39793.1 hypothetical protein M441DRAFT_420042 [Trichoderma asperellum CBS 433.97]
MPSEEPRVTSRHPSAASRGSYQQQPASKAVNKRMISKRTVVSGGNAASKLAIRFNSARVIVRSKSTVFVAESKLDVDTTVVGTCYQQPSGQGREAVVAVNGAADRMTCYGCGKAASRRSSQFLPTVPIIFFCSYHFPQQISCFFPLCSHLRLTALSSNFFLVDGHPTISF